MKSGFSASDVAKIIRNTVCDRLGGRKPDYLVSDSATVDVAAVRLYMYKVGNE